MASRSTVPAYRMSSTISTTAARNKRSTGPGPTLQRPCACLPNEDPQSRVARTAALAITGQGDGTWLIDADGEPVCPAWLWLDARSAPIIESLARRRISDRSCSRLLVRRLTPPFRAARSPGSNRHRPESLRRAASALHCKDWLYFKATGERATDPSEGIFTYRQLPHAHL